ncbi:MAG: hypothetical protein II304_14430 [Bacteroidales bacterium]|nr:hypothetical protein [Bacteroidales bacterium]
MEENTRSNKSVSTITIPAGKELKKIAIFCSKHGDITDSAVKFETTRVDIRGNKVTDRNCYCMACLNELLIKFQESGEIGKIGFVPIVGDPEPKQPSED